APPGATRRELCGRPRGIWADRAGPAGACAEVRRLMGLEPAGRLAAGLPDAQVSAKSGSLLGVVRNEVGVVEFPSGERYAIAVFTRLPKTYFGAGPQIDHAIGQVAAVLVKELQGRQNRG